LENRHGPEERESQPQQPMAHVSITLPKDIWRSLAAASCIDADIAIIASQYGTKPLWQFHSYRFGW